MQHGIDITIFKTKKEIKTMASSENNNNKNETKSYNWSAHRRIDTQYRHPNGLRRETQRHVKHSQRNVFFFYHFVSFSPFVVVVVAAVVSSTFWYLVWSVRSERRRKKPKKNNNKTQHTFFHGDRQSLFDAPCISEKYRIIMETKKAHTMYI